MGHELSLFVGMFATLLAIINPFEVLPVYLRNGHRCDHPNSWLLCLGDARTSSDTSEMGRPPFSSGAEVRLRLN